MKTAQKKSARFALFGAAAFMAAATFAANTWWVDDACYGAAVQDGSEGHPFGTILVAITNSACKAGDTISYKGGGALQLWRRDGRI